MLRRHLTACLLLVFLLVGHGSCSGFGDLIMGLLDKHDADTTPAGGTGATRARRSSTPTTPTTTTPTTPSTSTRPSTGTSVKTTDSTAGSYTPNSGMTQRVPTKCYDLTCNQMACLANETAAATDRSKCRSTLSDPCFVTFVRSDNDILVTAGCNMGTTSCDSVYSRGDKYLRWTKCCSTELCNDDDEGPAQSNAGDLRSTTSIVLTLSAAVRIWVMSS